MKLTDRLWQDKWSKTRFTPSPLDFSAEVRKLAERNHHMLFGTDDEPGSSIWMASLSEAMGRSFREGMTVLDYGCGAGRYAHFLRQRLKNFKYYGLEKPGGEIRHGEQAIASGREIFQGDGRIVFGLLGEQLEAEAIERAGVVLLASIFTHIDLGEMERILLTLRPVTTRGGKIVCSAFLGEAYQLEGKGALYGFPDCYYRVWFTQAQLNQLRNRHRWIMTGSETFVAQDVNVHRIMALSRKPPALDSIRQAVKRWLNVPWGRGATRTAD